MAEDATRRLLRAFGIAATDCEEAIEALAAALDVAAGGSAGRAVDAVEAYGRTARELAARWADVGGLVHGYQARAQQAIEVYLRAAAPAP